MIDYNYNIEFFLDWLNQSFSTLNRFYNPGSFNKKSSDAVEYYRINDLNIEFCTNKIIDVIAKYTNTKKPKGNTVKEMREFLETLVSKLEEAKARYEKNNPGKSFVYILRTKYVPNFLMNFLYENAVYNEETTEKNSIRISDHNTALGADESLKKFIDYMSIVEYCQEIDIYSIGRLFNIFINVLKKYDDNQALSFSKFKSIFGEMLKSRLMQENKNYKISEIIYDIGFEEKIIELMTALKDTSYGEKMFNEIMSNMENIKRIRKIFMLIYNGNLDELTIGSDEKYGDESLVVYSTLSPIVPHTEQEESFKIIPKDDGELPIEIVRMISCHSQKNSIATQTSLKQTGSAR